MQRHSVHEGSKPLLFSRTLDLFSIAVTSYSPVFSHGRVFTHYVFKPKPLPLSVTCIEESSSCYRMYYLGIKLNVRTEPDVSLQTYPRGNESKLPDLEQTGV